MSFEIKTRIKDYLCIRARSLENQRGLFNAVCANAVGFGVFATPTEQILENHSTSHLAAGFVPLAMSSTSKAQCRWAMLKSALAPKSASAAAAAAAGSSSASIHRFKGFSDVLPREALGTYHSSPPPPSSSSESELESSKASSTAVDDAAAASASAVPPPPPPPLPVVLPSLSAVSTVFVVAAAASSSSSPPSPPPPQYSSSSSSSSSSHDLLNVLAALSSSYAVSRLLALQTPPTSTTVELTVVCNAGDGGTSSSSGSSIAATTVPSLKAYVECLVAGLCPSAVVSPSSDPKVVTLSLSPFPPVALPTASAVLGGGYWPLEECGTGTGTSSSASFSIYRYVLPSPSPSAPFYSRERTDDSSNAPPVSAAGLLSHRLYGVDNTGQRKVWDAERIMARYVSTLFLDGSAPGYDYHEEQDDDEEKNGGCTQTHAHHRRTKGTTTPSSSSCADALVAVPVAPVASNVSLTPPPPPLAVTVAPFRVVELGSGMAALASLSLYSLAAQGHLPRPLELLVTDGHPASVFNNFVNCHLTRSAARDGGSSSSSSSSEGGGESTTTPPPAKLSSIMCRRLLWDSGPGGLSDVRSLLSPDPFVPFDLCLVSDCVHFQEFHAALVMTIGRLLKVGGTALLLQPPRSGSLANLMELLHGLNASADSEGRGKLFNVEHRPDFDEGVSSAGRDYYSASSSNESQSTSPGVFDPDLHLPQLLVLTLRREVDEQKDGNEARDLQRRREEERDKRRMEKREQGKENGQGR